MDWSTKYTEKEAKRGIRLEAGYLGFLFVLLPISILFVWLKAMDSAFQRYPVWAEQGDRLTYYMLAWLGGTLGGTLFSTKWLYHSVAKQVWHVDRRLWRIFTPHLSGALAFATFLIISSGLLPIIDKKALDSEGMALSAGFVIGYFSDSATAKLTEVAETLFGSNRR